MTTSILAFAGSLRTNSLNRRLVGAAQTVAPAGINLTIFDDLGGVPLFNEDLEDRALTEHAAIDELGDVVALRTLVARSDGVLIATPEYNQSIPGVMKNVVDWLSRPEDAGLLDGKPVAIMGATTGPWGTRYAQKELRHVLTATGAIVMPQPMLFVPNGDNAFDALGRLSDPTVERRLLQLLTAFDRWIELVTPANHTLSLSA
jgi:chromate reductase